MPDFSILTLQAVVEFLTTGQVMVTSSTVGEFHELTTMLGIYDINQQVVMVMLNWL